jgi:hypothetical protein
MEEPGYPGARRALLRAGARLVPVRVDEQGLDVEAGARQANDARLAVVSPSHQFPLGVPMSLARRLALLKWARSARAWVIEDDYDSEFRYGARPIPCLHGLDVDGRVIYVGSFSKTLFPALRLGFQSCARSRERLVAAVSPPTSTRRRSTRPSRDFILEVLRVICGGCGWCTGAPGSPGRGGGAVLRRAAGAAGADRPPRARDVAGVDEARVAGGRRAVGRRRWRLTSREPSAAPAASFSASASSAPMRQARHGAPGDGDRGGSA